jgi:hypothetical protein
VVPSLGIVHADPIHHDHDLLEAGSPEAEIALGRGAGKDLDARGPLQEPRDGPYGKGVDLLPTQDLDAPGEDRELRAHPGAHLHVQGIQRDRGLLGGEVPKARRRAEAHQRSRQGDDRRKSFRREKDGPWLTNHGPL